MLGHLLFTSFGTGNSRADSESKPPGRGGSLRLGAEPRPRPRLLGSEAGPGTDPGPAVPGPGKSVNRLSPKVLGSATSAASTAGVCERERTLNSHTVTCLAESAGRRARATRPPPGHRQAARRPPTCAIRVGQRKGGDTRSQRPRVSKRAESSWYRPTCATRVQPLSPAEAAAPTGAGRGALRCWAGTLAFGPKGAPRRLGALAGPCTVRMRESTTASDWLGEATTASEQAMAQPLKLSINYLNWVSLHRTMRVRLRASNSCSMGPTFNSTPSNTTTSKSKKRSCKFPS